MIKKILKIICLVLWFILALCGAFGYARAVMPYISFAAAAVAVVFAVLYFRERLWRDVAVSAGAAAALALFGWSFLAVVG